MPLPDLRPWVSSSLREAPLRLFCLPFAGGGTAPFFGLQRHLPGVDVVPILLPGRESRLRERPITDVKAIASAVHEAISPALDRPYALLGYSMGATIGFEIARAIRRAGDPMPEMLLVAACRAPQLSLARPPVYQLSDAALIEVISRRYQAIPAAVLAEPELLEMVIPIIRADFTAVDTYRHVSEPPLDVPIHGWFGSEDASTPRVDMEPWRAHTTRKWALIELPTGHFFHTDPRFLSDLAAALATI